jgi:hypothetical protein
MAFTQRVIPSLQPIPDIEMRKTLTIVASFIAMEVGRATMKINAGIRVLAISARKMKATTRTTRSSAGYGIEGDNRKRDSLNDAGKACKSGISVQMLKHRFGTCFVATSSRDLTT